MIRTLSPLSVFLAALSVAFVAGPTQARQVLLVADYNGNSLVGAVGEYSAITGAAINATFVSGSGGVAMALDGNNHLFVSRTSSIVGAYNVAEYNATTGATINSALISFGPPFYGSAQLAVDGNNHLYVSNSNHTVGQYDATTGATINSAFVTGHPGQVFSNPTGLVADGNNHLFVANRTLLGQFGAQAVGQFDNATGAAVNSAFVVGSTTFEGIALDSNNHLFVTTATFNTVGEYDATTGATLNAVLIGNNQGLANPHGLALDGNNHLFVANFANGTVGEYNATTGATINASFITGLHNPTDLLFVAPVPEPSSLLLVAGAGVTAAGMWRRRRARMASVEA